MFGTSVSIKSEREIELMRESNRLLTIVHKEMEEKIRMLAPGRFEED